MKTRILVGAAVLVLAGAAGATTAVASGDDGERSVTGPQAASATAAALAATGGGTANSVERDSENGAVWEVEVTRPDGVTVDVRLDRRYAVVVIEGDSDKSEGKNDGHRGGDSKGDRKGG